MNPNLIFEIVKLAVSLAEDVTTKNARYDLDAADTLLEIVQRTAHAYEQHTGEPLDPALIRLEKPPGAITQPSGQA